VGNSTFAIIFHLLKSVHPHTRGEFAKQYTCRPCGAGSPPHAWGILYTKNDVVAVHRFTPTRVGNSNDYADNSSAWPVHPHTRGEFNGVKYLYLQAHGSPPHAWGILKLIQMKSDGERFTPTRVGNSFCISTHSFTYSVHPHTRGEFVEAAGSNFFLHGSPPHAWGIRIFKQYEQQHNRFTPTRVGNSGDVNTHTKLMTVHPHTRGEFFFVV